ncbi:lysophospholipid acyltransferase family protein [Limobrevibacterium gyesilva]|uniref:lysophospholipid acyltransferase family protein n=1 Tax=Limobrevibacterium gyesilva TaxID=2991712 RepID=UPI002227DE17|nr:lysophospholipid acyltransferase family protein [Limobrevibacterium gyesilva]
MRRPAAQALLAWLLGRYLDFALRTTRWTLHGDEHLAPFAAGHRAVVAFWHERLPLMPALWTLAKRQGGDLRAHILASRHQDGRFLGEVMRRFGVSVVHGSTQRDGRDRGGAASVLTMLDVLDDGGLVVLTPDGPRGPRRQAAPGVAQLAARSGAPVLPCAAQTSRRRILGSWDRMILPLPWGRGVLVCGPAILVPRDGWQESLPQIAKALSDAADAADRLCG